MWRSNLKNITPNNEEHEEEDVDDDDERELTRAFAEDTRSTNWPPRSYTCNFCRREFKSAQALGGHMNIHRRDRARLNQPQVVQDPVAMTDGASASFGVNYYPYMFCDNRNSHKESNNYDIVKVNNREEIGVEELDLELRLGQIPKSGGRMVKNNNNNNVVVLPWR